MTAFRTRKHDQGAVAPTGNSGTAVIRSFYTAFLAAAHAARAAELAAGDGWTVATCNATPAVLDVLKRYPPAPAGE